jgi:hypothetical protein
MFLKRATDLSLAALGALWTIAPQIGFGYAAAMMFLGAALLGRVAVR